MKRPYPYDSITLNGKSVLIASILSGDVLAQSDFEQGTIQFIQDWFNNVHSFVLKTSGSTGAPKDIVVTRTQMIASARATEKAIDLRQGYHAFICLDTRFIAGKMMIARSFVTGMRMTVVDPSANPFERQDENNPIDFVAMVPYQIEAVLKSPRASILNRIGSIIIGGAPLTQSSINQLSNYRCSAFLTYGMTETISHIALCKLKYEHEPIFKALPGIDLSLDPRHCLVIKVPYIKELVITNDIVDLVDADSFRWLGRWDNVINTGGIKVHPEKIEYQIEKILESLKVGRNFFITGIKDDKMGELVTLLIEGRQDDMLKEILQNRLKTQIERFERPRNIIFIDRFLYTPANKLDRRATRKAL